MAKYKIAADTAAQAAAVESLKWGAERRTGALKVALDHHAEALNAMNKGLGEGKFILDDTNLGIYTEAFNRWRKTQKDYYASVGLPSTGDTITHLTPFFKSIFDDWAKKNPNGDPATLKWGKEKGLWGDVVNKLDPDINRDDAHTVWKSMWESRFGDYEKKKTAASTMSDIETLATPLLGVGGLLGKYGAQGLMDIVPSDPKESWSQALGTPVDIIAGAMRPFGYSEEKPFMGSEWISEKLGPSDRDKPVITPSGSYTSASLFPGAGGLISGISDFMKGQAIREESGMPKAKDIKTLEKTVKSLEEVESDAQKRELIDEKPKSIPVASAERDISQEAASFLAKLLEYMTAYGEEEARVILSQEFSELSNSAKNELQSHLMTESEALA
jgi:hypothetical protein